MTCKDLEPEKIREILNLGPHPEGIKFRELYRSERQIKVETGDNPFEGARSAGTAIHALVGGTEHVRWHRNRSDLMLFWHAGGPFQIHQLKDDGSYKCDKLGNQLSDQSCSLFVHVPYGTYYAEELAPGSDYVLFSGVVVPGFDPKDWEVVSAKDLAAKFPAHKDIIEKLD